MTKEQELADTRFAARMCLLTTLFMDAILERFNEVKTIEEKERLTACAVAFRCNVESIVRFKTK